MLHLKFALSLEKLADEMIDEISRCWKDPFEAPVVIFPDPKLEQWFRLRWVQKKGVVANLNKSTIDRFLFNILAGDNESRQKLSADMLTNVILAYLMKQEDGTENYKKLDPEVTRYLCGDKGVLDENHKQDGFALFGIRDKPPRRLCEKRERRSARNFGLLETRRPEIVLF